MANTPCSCGSTILLTTERHTTVCTECGIEKKVPTQIRNIHVSYAQAHHQPFASSYSRNKRFASMLDAVVLATCQVSDEPMLAHLHSLKITFKTIGSILTAMKKSALRDKRYTSLHMFCRVLLEGYVKPPPVLHWFIRRRNMLNFFSDIEMVHQTTFKQPFLNYTWLLATVLRLNGLARYCVFVKKLKCKKRIKRYEQDFAVIKNKLDRSNRYAAVPGHALGSRTQPSE